MDYSTGEKNLNFVARCTNYDEFDFDGNASATVHRQVPEDNRHPKIDSNGMRGHGGKNLNINLPNNNAVLRLEVELSDRNAENKKRGAIPVRNTKQEARKFKSQIVNEQENNLDVPVPMEKILEQLLTELKIEHVSWTTDKKGYYHQVLFPIKAGEPCETTLHCLTELGIGKRLNSIVSVLPCSVRYDAIADFCGLENSSDDPEDISKWNAFVDSIKSKLTVKQVVDGVRAGGSLSFDYLLLIVTADSLAALGLIENNAPNIVAAMLVSPLMGPVMSITFGFIISDRELMKVGFITLALGMFISLLFGFIFGLIVGTTEMPWGFTDWPTEEMKGRGNVRSLWMGVCWALTSGTGVAVALLQGATGPLIGVAISASLLPPVVNCGLFWALACIWLIYPNMKMPHLHGEPYAGNSSYNFLYTNYVPTEFFINGIVSGLLTVVNVICIFITAIIILKIKEVAAPYTSSPDLRRFWETDIRTVRRTNRSTIRGRRTTQPYAGLTDPKTRELKTTIEQALKEATDDATFRKVKRMSYSSNAAGEITQRLPFTQSYGKEHLRGSLDSGHTPIVSGNIQMLEKLISSLLEQRSDQAKSKPEDKINRRRTLSRSLTNIMGRKNCNSQHSSEFQGTHNTPGIQLTSLMPTILEQTQHSKSTWPEKRASRSSLKNVLHTIATSTSRLSQTPKSDDENVNILE